TRATPGSIPSRSPTMSCPSAGRSTAASARSTALKCSTSIPNKRAPWWSASSVNELTERQVGGILTLRLNQPEVRNALGSAMVETLHAALERARQDATVGAVIIAASGDAFSAGADLKEFLAERPSLEQALERRRLGALFLLIEAYPKALVAAVNGDALGAGFGLVAACHLAVAAEEAHFGLPGVRLGIMPMTI